MADEQERPQPTDLESPDANFGNRVKWYTDDERAAMKAQALDVFRKTFSQNAAAAAIGVNRRTIWIWRKTDPAFAADWQDAYEGTLDGLEGGLVQRANDPTIAPKDRNTAAIMVLNAHREGYSRSAGLGGGAGNVQINFNFGKPEDFQRLQEPPQEPPRQLPPVNDDEIINLDAWGNRLAEDR